MGEQVLIQLHGLGKSFSEGDQQHKILKSINLSIASNDFVAITGASGSGKSTLLSIIGLLDQHDQGDYLLCGHPVTALSRYQLAQLRNRSIGWIFQNFNLVQDMTVHENVMLPLRYQSPNSASKPARNAELAVNGALAAVGIADKASQYPSQLSGGQQQRVAIARAIVTEPDLILADEPTGNLDSQNSEMIFQLLQQLHQQGRTIVMVTHDMQQAQRCASQVVLSDGEVASINRTAVDLVSSSLNFIADHTQDTTDVI